MKKLILCSLVTLSACTYYEYDCGTGPHGPFSDPDVSRFFDAGPPPPSGDECHVHGDCLGGEGCVEDRCEPSASCVEDAHCPDGEICDYRRTCVDPVGCRDSVDCGASEVCVEDRCTPLDSACHFDLDCGPGRGCVNNACRALCVDDSECSASDRCVDGRCHPDPAPCETSADCGAGHCVSARCLFGCADDSECAAGEACGDDGLCRSDVAPRPFCSVDTDCAEGRLCREGVCRTPCPTGTDDECRRWDEQFVRCATSEGGELLCYTRNESDPECARSSDCASGESCVDAICR